MKISCSEIIPDFISPIHPQDALTDWWRYRMYNPGNHHVVTTLPGMISGFILVRFWSRSVNKIELVLCAQSRHHGSTPWVVVAYIKHGWDKRGSRTLIGISSFRKRFCWIQSRHGWFLTNVAKENQETIIEIKKSENRDAQQALQEKCSDTILNFLGNVWNWKSYHHRENAEKHIHGEEEEKKKK